MHLGAFLHSLGKYKEKFTKTKGTNSNENTAYSHCPSYFLPYRLRSLSILGGYFYFYFTFCLSCASM